VEGSKSNVIGLPLEETLALLDRARAGADPA
jgi:predicted house-cleaning NTP pyrophosphatase (Maf/HAM1 superfamily)